MGFRRFLDRLVKPAAMVGVVGTLSLGLVVTTPATAEALVKYPKIDVDTKFITGAVKTVAPVAMAAVSVTPIGWGMRLAQLGMLAYSTSDMWIPFVTGALGVGTGSAADPGTQYADKLIQNTANLRVQAQSVRVGTINGIQAVIMVGEYTGNGTGEWIMQYEFRTNCQRPDGSRYSEAHSSSAQSFSTTKRTNQLSWNNPCNGGGLNVDKIVGIWAGPLREALVKAENPNAALGSVWTTTADTQTWGDLTTGPSSFDPRGAEVGYQGSSECIDANGTKSWVTGPTVPGDNGAMLMPSCEKAGKGHGTGRTTVKAFKPDGTTETVWDTGANPLTDPATPLCDPGRTSSGCTLEVTKDGQPCTTGDVECENWAEESKKEDQKARYGCNFGPYRLPASACGLLEKAYVPGGAPLNDENTDGEPSTSSPLGPAGQPATAPAPVIAPGITGSPAPGGSGSPAPGPGAEQEKARQCFPNGWAVLNPVEWVLKPIRCAFEPAKSLQARVTAMQAKFDNRVPVSWFGGSIAGASGGSCPVSWAVEFRGQSHSLICGTQAESIIRGFRPVMGAMLIMAMLWPLLRSLFYAAIPVFKVTPS